MVESRVEARYLRQVRKSAMKRFDKMDLFRQVLRIEWCELTQLLDHFLGDQRRVMVLRFCC